MNPVHHRCQKPIRIVLVVFGLALVAGLAFSWYTISSLISSVRSVRSDSCTATAFSHWAKLKLFASTRNSQARAEGFRMGWRRPVLKPPVGDAPAFLATNRLQRLPGASRPQNVLKLPWFNPVHALEAYKPRPVSDEQVTTPSGFYPTVFLEPQKTGVVTVSNWAYTI